MIKALLGLSLILNLVLGYFLYSHKKPHPEEGRRERLIIETHPQKDPPPAKMKKVPKAAPKSEEEAAEEKPEPPEFIGHDSYELQDAGEQMMLDRNDYFINKLGATPEKIKEHEKIRNEFYEKSSKFWQKNPMRELTFAERREMIQMEEDLHKKLKALHGEENWVKYQKYRENYNNRGYQKQMETGEPFIFMGL